MIKVVVAGWLSSVWDKRNLVELWVSGIISAAGEASRLFFSPASIFRDIFPVFPWKRRVSRTRWGCGGDSPSEEGWNGEEELGRLRL
jgi:hypothetical protein